MPTPHPSSRGPGYRRCLSFKPSNLPCPSTNEEPLKTTWERRVSQRTPMFLVVSRSMLGQCPGGQRMHSPAAARSLDPGRGACLFPGAALGPPFLLLILLGAGRKSPGRVCSGGQRTRQWTYCPGPGPPVHSQPVPAPGYLTMCPVA